MIAYFLLYIALAFGVAGLTFIFFVAIITIKAHWSMLSKPVKVIVAPWAIVGILIDVILNLFFSWLFLLSMPREMLFTGHCDRLLKEQSIQGKLARSWCSALDLFEQGGHCHAN